MSLYDITADYRELFDNFDNADDLTDEQIEAYFDTLEAIEGDFEIKAVNIACYIKELKAEIELFKAEEATLKARRQTKENLEKRLKKMLVDGMKAIKKDKIDKPRARLTLKSNPESADVGDEEEFIKWAQTHDRDDLLNYSAPKVAKTAVKNAIHDGAELPDYVKLIRTTSVIIK